MIPSPEDRIRIEQQFDCFIKVVLAHCIRSYKKKYYRIKERELPMADPKAHVRPTPSYNRQEPILETIFHALHHNIPIEDEDLAQAMESLPEEKRTIFLLYHLLDVHDAEISQGLGINLNTVKSARHRTMQRLQKKFQKKED